MWQKLTNKIKTSMERASGYFIPPALCISSLDLGGLLFPFQNLQMSFYFWDSVYSPSYNLIFRHQSSGNGWKQMNTSYDHDSSILSWIFGGSPHRNKMTWPFLTQEIFFRDIVDNCNFGRQNITYNFICLILWLKCALSFFLFALG